MVKIKVFQKKGGAVGKPKHHKLFIEPYPNVFLIARKKSGKTNVIQNILYHAASPKSTVYIFSTTVNKDGQWRAIVQMLKDKGVPYEKHTNMDRLAELINEEEPDSDDEEQKKKPKGVMIFRDSDKPPEEREEHETPKKKERKPKYIVPEMIIILDDMGKALVKSRTLEDLVRRNRHSKAMVLCSSQYLKDVSPSVMANIDNFLIFPGLREKKKQQHLYDNIRLAESFEQFRQLYKHATAEKYNFLYIDVENGEYRKNFNIKLNPPDIESDSEDEN